ncbi:transglutaminase family protein [Mesorhizobium sp. NBSH29]|uniref:transglutaminase family protein n=1 Tax=Mesorhizobium sp. NBSH29 TaxID=2654249 RepID=UPI00189666A8|nr:transglutaminase family protein [Mesorhizobium sp. NBSH29]QPC87698.1 transglutaminase family protein [Mesorhizobium sp. NBSH29]
MLLKVSHRTEYHYDAPVLYALQRVRLVPYSGTTQTVKSWALNIEGAREEVRYTDQFGNDTRLLSVEGAPNRISVEATGEVETYNTAGVMGAHLGFAPLWLFRSETALTTAGEGIRALTGEAGDGTELERLHRLMGAIHTRVEFIPGVTDSDTNAEEALQQGSGVCQDHSHIFITAARLLGFPARYISGYLMMDHTVEQTATHAWTEVNVPNLGWVAFDVANGISADERYLRIATGRDYRDAMPVSGIRLGQASERLAVHITVEQ